MPSGKGEGALCDNVFAWAVLARAGLAAYVQALQRRAHAPRIKDCKRFNLVIKYVEGHKRGLKHVTLQHPLTCVGCTEATFKAQPGEPTNLALRGLVAALGGAQTK